MKRPMEYKGNLYGKVGKSYIPLIDTTHDIDELRMLLREAVMRAHFALPENDQDAEWFDDPEMNINFVIKIFDALNIGNGADRH